MQGINQTPMIGRTPVGRRLWLCADDFALNAPVSEAITDLLVSDRLSITSCMSDSPLWPTAGTRLRMLGMAHRAGLHFNLTEAFPGYPAHALGQLMLQTRAGLANRRLIRHSLRRQLDRYETIMGAAPVFIDGHQHVHVFPAVRQVLLDELAQRYRFTPWLRNISPMIGPYPGAKARVLAMMGGTRFARQLRSGRWRSNRAFAGLYNLRPDGGFARHMLSWLARLPDEGLIMCHPATHAEPGDVIGPARAAEYIWLASEAWPQALAGSGVTLAIPAH